MIMEQQLILKSKTEEIQRTRDHLMQTKEYLLSFSNAYEQNNAIMHLTGVVHSAKRTKREKKIKKLKNLALKYRTDYSNFAITLLRKGKTSSHNSSTEVMNGASQSSKAATPVCLTPGLKKRTVTKRGRSRRKSHCATWVNRGIAPEKLQGVPIKKDKKKENEPSKKTPKENAFSKENLDGNRGSNHSCTTQKREESKEFYEEEEERETERQGRGLVTQKYDASVQETVNREGNHSDSAAKLVSVKTIAEKRKKLREIRREYEKRVQDHEEKVKTIKYLQNDLKLNYDHLRTKIDSVGRFSPDVQGTDSRQSSTTTALSHAKSRYRYSMVQTVDFEQKETKSQNNVNLKPISSRYADSVAAPRNHRYVPTSFNERDLTPGNGGKETSRIIVEKQFANEGSPSSMQRSLEPPIHEKGSNLEAGGRHKDSGSSPMSKNIKELIAGKKRDVEYKNSNSISRIDGRENSNNHMSSSTDNGAVFQGAGGDNLSKSYRNNHSTRLVTSRNIRMNSEDRSPGKQSPSKLMATSANFGHKNDRLGSLISASQTQKSQISPHKKMNRHIDDDGDPIDSIFSTSRVVNRTFQNEGGKRVPRQEEIDLFERKRENSGSNSKRGNSSNNPDILNMSRNVRKGVNNLKSRDMTQPQTRYVSFADYFKMKSVSKTLHENGMLVEASQESDPQFIS